MKENNIPILCLHVYNVLHFPITIFLVLPKLLEDLTSRSYISSEKINIHIGSILLYLLILTFLNISLAKLKTTYPVFVINTFTVIRGLSLVFNLILGLILLIPLSIQIYPGVLYNLVKP